MWSCFSISQSFQKSRRPVFTLFPLVEPEVVCISYDIYPFKGFRQNPRHFQSNYVKQNNSWELNLIELYTAYLWKKNTGQIYLSNISAMSKAPETMFYNKQGQMCTWNVKTYLFFQLTFGCMCFVFALLSRGHTSSFTCHQI